MTGQWRGRFLEDFAVGDVYRSRLGRTVTETDNTWRTAPEVGEVFPTTDAPWTVGEANA